MEFIKSKISLYLQIIFSKSKILSIMKSAVKNRNIQLFIDCNCPTLCQFWKCNIGQIKKLSLTSSNAISKEIYNVIGR